MIEALTPIAVPVIESLVNNLVTPKLKNLAFRFKAHCSKQLPIEASDFTEYYTRVYKRISIINTLVFNNSQLSLKEIFVPLTLRNSDPTVKTLEHKVEGYLETLFYKYEKILITDTAGMGKSTIAKKIFLDIVDQNKCIPILIELRRLTEKRTILSELHEQLSSIDREFEIQLLLDLLKDGGFFIIFDGYDEISLSERESVTADLQDFISKITPNNKFLLTSRPEDALVSFGDFQKFTIMPLKKNEAFELLRKYDKQGTISTQLINKLDEPDMTNISEFLRNPLLVSLLFTAFQYKQVIPFKKYIFYRQVYDANFESHDLSKGDSFLHNKHSKLAIDDFHKILRHIGYSCLKHSQNEFSKDQMIELINKSREFHVEPKFNSSDFLKDILMTVPLFVQDGLYYRWAHKSLQEYFAAQFIYLDTKNRQIDILKTIYNHKELPKFHNVLDLYYDMDFKGFRNIIIYELLKEYKVHYNTYLCNIGNDISQEEIIRRKELCFLVKPHVFRTKLNLISRDQEESKEFAINFQKLIPVNNSTNEYKFHSLLCKESLHGIHFYYLQNSKIELLGLLYKKNHSFVKWDKNTYVGKVEYNINIENEWEAIEVNDNPKNLCNSKSKFTETNRLLSEYRSSPYLINSREAFDYLKEIEDSIKSESDTDLLSVI